MLPESFNKNAKIPNSSHLNSRYFVPDLSPYDRQDLKLLRPQFIFVAESPHVNEVEPESQDERRPLCGAAGRQWWGLLSEILEGRINQDVSLPRLVSFCMKYGLVVMNASQYPLDPKVTRVFPEADPVGNLGFSKAAGPYSFKRMKNSLEVRSAVQRLARRLNHSSVANLPVFPLGNDAEWFVTRALEESSGLESSGLGRIQDKIPHPSAWWRKGGWFGKVAREKLQNILTSKGLSRDSQRERPEKNRRSISR